VWRRLDSSWQSGVPAVSVGHCTAGLLALVTACMQAPRGPLDASRDGTPPGLDGTGADDIAPTDHGPIADAPDASADLGPPPPDVDADTAVDTGMDGATPDAGLDATSDLGMVAIGDAPPGFDAPPYEGYLRFLQLAQGIGTVRFIATVAPGFEGTEVEAVVPEGGSSGYVLTTPVPYFLNVIAAPGIAPGVWIDGHPATDTDGGLSDAAPSEIDAHIPRLTPFLYSDVYVRAGCTVVLAGSATGSADSMTDLRLWRVPDIPMRTGDPGIGLLRVVGAVPGGPAMDLGDDAGALATSVGYMDPTGLHRATSGLRDYTVRAATTGAVLRDDLAVRVAEGEPQTLYVWGLPGADGGPGIRGTVTRDLPPGR